MESSVFGSTDGRGKELAADTILGFASYGEDLYAAFSSSDKAISYCVYDLKLGNIGIHKGWSDPYLTGAYGHSPSLIEYRGSLYMVYSKDNGEIWWAKYDRGWTHGKALRGGGAYTSDRVGLAIFLNKIWLIARGVGGDQNLWWSTFDGNEWSTYSKMGASSSHGPALATFRGELHIVASGGGDDHRIWHYCLNPLLGRRSRPLNHVFTAGAPSLAIFGESLHCAAVGMEKTIWHMSYSDGGWSVYKQTQLRSQRGPSLSAYRDKLSNRDDMLLCYDPRM
ncbi:putative BNR repeat-containing glycosyl [Rosellinia necatrix]|uniref:Putative BNR repeat-containing glycosyl n=1 Tax=Rosellinia necatrix TaxID=77044 RepID=A0A1S8ABF8_ROSNE|nr:putative BNR repeat-containing glycosyl [Rosellinia necatrix]